MKLSEIQNLEDKKGIYKIYNTKSKKSYIGSTEVSFRKRAKEHRWALRGNYHKNNHLQNSYNKYGEEVFDFEVIEYLSKKEDILDCEQKYLDDTKWSDLYNINRQATKVEITKKLREYRSKYMTELWEDEEFREKMIEKNQNPWNKGKTDVFSEETLNKMSKSAKNRSNQDYVVKRQKEERRKNMKSISVYNLDGKHLGTYKNIDKVIEANKNKDLLVDKDNMKFKRGKRSSNTLLKPGIYKCCRGDSDSYKGLKFEYCS